MFRSKLLLLLIVNCLSLLWKYCYVCYVQEWTCSPSTASASPSELPLQSAMTARKKLYLMAKRVILSGSEGSGGLSPMISSIKECPRAGIRVPGRSSHRERVESPGNDIMPLNKFAQGAPLGYL